MYLYKFVVMSCTYCKYGIIYIVQLATKSSRLCITENDLAQRGPRSGQVIYLTSPPPVAGWIGVGSAGQLF